MKIFSLVLDNNLIVEVASTGHRESRQWWQRDYIVGQWIPYQANRIPGMSSGDGWYEKDTAQSKELVQRWALEFAILRARIWLKECDCDTVEEALEAFPALLMPKHRDGSGGTIECPQPSMDEIKDTLIRKKFAEWRVIKSEKF